MTFNNIVSDLLVGVWNGHSFSWSITWRVNNDMQGRKLHEKNPCFEAYSQKAKKFPTFYGNWRCTTGFKRHPLNHTLSQINPVHTSVPNLRPTWTLHSPRRLIYSIIKIHQHYNRIIPVTVNCEGFIFKHRCGHFFFHDATAAGRPGHPHCLGCRMTLRHTTISRNPLD